MVRDFLEGYKLGGSGQIDLGFPKTAFERKLMEFYLERIRVFGLEVWGLIRFRLTVISRLVDLEAIFVP